MNNLCLKVLLILLTVTSVIVATASSAFAVSAETKTKSFYNGGKNIICIAHRGDWQSFPENSAEAINAALECDAISVDIKLTSDSKPVLMADTTVDRMCVNADGSSASGEISSFTLAKLKEFFLRRGNGGNQNPKTDCKIAELNEIYTIINGQTALILNLSKDDVKSVYDYVKSLNKLDETIFRIDAKQKEIVELTKSFDGIRTVGNYQGNVIFLATSAAENSFENGINTVELGSKNAYGVIYGSYVMKRFSGTRRAMISMVNGMCGSRTDSESGWDDLISRGYSVIETNFPSELNAYIKKTEAAAIELQNTVDLYGGTELSPYTTDSEDDFTTALETAKTLLENPSSFSELTDARTALRTAYNSLTEGEKKIVTLKFEFSFGKLLAALLCAAAYVVWTLFLRKKRTPAP